jgi:hypothetical protein
MGHCPDTGRVFTAAVDIDQCLQVADECLNPASDECMNVNFHNLALLLNLIVL